MRKMKKILALTASAALLVTASVAGTLAYLTSTTETVKNTFTVGEVELKLWEHMLDEDGVISESKTYEGNAYEDILPGLDYPKDPTVTVIADSEDCYVRMLLTVTYDKDADAVFAKYNYQDWFNWSTDWIKPTDAPETEMADGKISRTYEFRYKDIVEEDANDKDLAPLFTTITVPEELDNDELATLEDLKINVIANAIQAAGFDNADEAWDAFDAK